MDKPVSRLPRYVAQFLYRMRVGIDPDIGGWEMGQASPTPCPWCRSALNRETALPHFFGCPSLARIRLELGLPEDGVPTRYLWGTAKEMEAALRYRQKCMSWREERSHLREPQAPAREHRTPATARRRSSLMRDATGATRLTADSRRDRYPMELIAPQGPSSAVVRRESAGGDALWAQWPPTRHSCRQSLGLDSVDPAPSRRNRRRDPTDGRRLLLN
eukprot:gene178-biopygen158